MLTTDEPFPQRKDYIPLIAKWRENGERIVFTNGCFDVIHPGHVDILRRAKSLGDRLVVGLNSDASVRRLKGDSRPIIGQEDRLMVLAELRSVDLVVVFEEDTPINLLREIRPDILVKGSDYTLDGVVGRELVESYGGTVVLLQLVDGYSTTNIVRKMSNGGQ